MSTWLNKTMCNTLDFILRSAWWHIIGLLYKVQSWKKKIQYYENQLPGGHSGCFPNFRIRIIWIILISKCRKGIFYRLLFSYMQTLNARQNSVYSSSQQTFECTEKSKSLSILYSQNFPNLENRMGVGQMVVGNRFSFVLWKALTPRKSPILSHMPVIKPGVAKSSFSFTMWAVNCSLCCLSI